jgi:hypothetical protein
MPPEIRINLSCISYKYISGLASLHFESQIDNSPITGRVAYRQIDSASFYPQPVPGKDAGFEVWESKKLF